MAQTKHQIQALLAEAQSAPRHRFGQNFMIDQNLVRVVAEAGQISAGDLVIEVGPGTGTLTEEILASEAQVLAVEIDHHLAGLLRQRFAGEERFRLIEGDVLAGKHELNGQVIEAIGHARSSGRPCKLVANLPYNVASPLIIELLIAGVELLAFTVQKEVAERLRADSGSGAFGALTVMARLLSRVEILRTLPAQAFWPAPRIESTLVRMTREDRLGLDAAGFGQFVQRLFSARRKTLRKALSQADFDADGLLAAAKLDGKLRPEDLHPEQFLGLYRAARGTG
jgi:16S rRNA (adenine1518-N6/adenine1519-N6)-dimethyltransferase